MAGVSGTQLSEGPRAMVKDFSTSVRTGVCVCALSHTAVGAVSELSRLSSFLSRPEFTSHRCDDRSSQLSSAPRTSYSMPVPSGGVPTHPSSNGPDSRA